MQTVLAGASTASGSVPMYSEKTLSIPGHHGEPVPNTFVQQDGATDRLAILLPGLGYSCAMPLFYYAESFLLDDGFDVLHVEYAYNRRVGFRELPQSDQIAWLLADATAAHDAGTRQRAYREVTVIGKSLGTRAMGHLLTEQASHQHRCAVWLTPLLRDDRLREQIRRYSGHSFFAIGADDPHYDPAYLVDVGAAPRDNAVVIAGADHSLDVPHDVTASVDAVAQVLRALRQFLAQ